MLNLWIDDNVIKLFPLLLKTSNGLREELFQKEEEEEEDIVDVSFTVHFILITKKQQ